MGHIRRAKSGRGWSAHYRDLQRRERMRTFATKREAERFLAAQEADLQRGAWRDPELSRRSFKQWADDWLASTINLKPQTRFGYEQILKNHVLPVFGPIRVDYIERRDVARFVAELNERAAPGTVRNAFAILRQVLNFVVRNNGLPANPALGTRLPRSPRKEMLFLEPAEILRLVDATDERFRSMVLFAAYTGLRAGEIGALRVGRIDWQVSRIEICESLSSIDGVLEFGPTKTHTTRSLRLPSFLMDALQAQVGANTDHRALVFTSADGQPIRHNLWYPRHFKPAVRRAGLRPELRFHDLRHTCAALLIAQGAHPRAIMERLGHSSIEVTLDRYGHLFPSLDESLADSLDDTYRASLLPPEDAA
jgi:integrase